MAPIKRRISGLDWKRLNVLFVDCVCVGGFFDSLMDIYMKVFVMWKSLVKLRSGLKAYVKEV